MKKALVQPSFETDPFAQFKKWYRHAARPGVLRWILTRIYPPATLHQPDAMTLATASKDGKPSARVVLYKGLSHGGFVFYTNYTSRKGQELTENPLASLVFHWGFPERQIRIEGKIEKLTPHESEAYWSTRPRGSQLSALVSPQSCVIASKEPLREKQREMDRQYGESSIPCPEFWGGFRVVPERIEFWEARVNRFHDRTCYLKKAEGWEIVRLAP